MKFIKNIFFLFRYSWGISKRRFWAAGIDIIFNSIEPFIYLIFPTLIINELTESKNWDRVLFYIGLFIVCVLLFRALRILFNVFINMSINRSDVKMELLMPIILFRWIMINLKTKKYEICSKEYLCMNERLDDFWVFPKLTKVENVRKYEDSFFDFLNHGEEPKSVTNLYIHIPFCDSACIFCPYYKSHGQQNYRKRLVPYVDAIITEMRKL